MKIAHVFWTTVPHLATGIVAKIGSSNHDAVFYLREVQVSNKPSIEANKILIKNAGSRFCGVLSLQNWVLNPRVGGYLRTFLQCFWLELTVKSLWKMIRGPKNWVLHGAVLSPMTMLLLTLMGKKVVLIHWGGHSLLADNGKISKYLSPLSLKLLRHVFVLMSPEVDVVKKWVCAEKVSCLPYWSNVKCESASSQCISQAKCIILGNSSWSVNLYSQVLDKIPSGSWERIICMLNYGMEAKQCVVDTFVEKYRKKFGGAFFPWRTCVPFEEYLKMMRSASFYLCPCKQQTGLGAIYNSIYAGKTVCLRGDNLSWVRSLGIEAVNIDELKDCSFETLAELAVSREGAESNKSILKNFFTTTVNFEIWDRKINACFGEG